MAVNVRYYTDPACIRSWSLEPVLRRLTIEFGAGLSFTFVMGGLAREIPDPRGLLEEWLDAAAQGPMPVDPGLWTEGPIATTYPACMAAIAASDQGAGERLLRALREGLVCFRRKLDTTEALVEEARRAGLDAKRFRIDLASHVTVEAFGAQLEEARAVAGGVLPAMRFGDGPPLLGARLYDEYAAAARAAGAEPAGGERLGVLDALRRFGSMAPAEVEAVCGLPGPRAHAELWGLVTEWRATATRVLGGHLFAAA